MDQDIDAQHLNGSARRAATQESDAGATIGAPERKKEYFSVRLTFSGTSQEFEDPRLAGEAFFRADPAERPSVTHVDGNSARTMARTELHGVHEGGETRYFKSLPDSHAPDAEFRAGFLGAMEASITERLEKVALGRGGDNVVERLDAGLKDDLEAFARREPAKAASLWSDRMEEPAPGPILQAAVKTREEVVEAEAQVGQVITAEQPQVVATGDWVTTDQNVELRPVAEHIPDAEATLGTGRFVDGERSAGFLPDELLAVTSYGRDGGSDVLAKFPDEGPLSEALARHLAESPVLAAHVEEDRLRSDFTADPARAISAWVAQSDARIDRLPSEQQEELRSEMLGIAKEAAAAFGMDRDRAGRETPPRSTLYSTAISPTTLTIAGEEKALQPGNADTLRASLALDARLAGIDAEKLGKRLETGAANVREEEAWVKSDLSDVARRDGHDLDNPQGRSAAAERLDRFYERAAEMIRSARGIDLPRAPDPMVEALDKMASLHAQQGSVAFRNETQARDFTEEMKERYGASVLKDMAAGRTDALVKDVPDASARQAMAAAVLSAAKEHPSLGLSAHEVETAERRMTAEAAPRPPEHARSPVHDRAHAKDREF